MKNRKMFKIDNRTREDVCSEIRELSLSYTPEWKFSRDDPDIGSVIGMIFAEQMEGSINRLNQSIFNYHTEFVNMLGVSLLPANPACSIVLMGLADNTIRGTIVPHGTQLLSKPVTREEDTDIAGAVQGDKIADDDREPAVFETAHDVYVTSSKITDIYMVSGDSGSVVPLLGELKQPDYFEKTKPAEEGKVPGENPYSELAPFSLYDFKGRGIEKNALIICHPGVFDVEDNNIFIRINGNEKLISGIAAGDYAFLYYAEDGMRSITSVKTEGNLVTLKIADENRKIVIDDKEYCAIVLESKKPVTENMLTDSILLSSSGNPESPEFIGNTAHEGERGRYLPFDDTISVFGEFYIGHDEYLNKAGATITITWKQEYEESVKRITAEEEAEDLRPIKRKPRVFAADTVADTYADEVIIEYFNGAGWKRLETAENMKKVFAGKNAGKITMSFVCPADIAPTEVSGFSGRSIRIQITRADNCYMVPCVHHYPVLKDIRVSYSYNDNFVKPDRCFAVCGTKREEITEKVKAGRPYVVFARSAYQETSLYIGFDRRFESGPVSLFFELEENAVFEGVKVNYEYSTLKGFKALKVADRTGSLTSSGIVMFMPPSDMGAVTLEGRKLFWIRMNRVAGEDKDTHPRIKNISLNAVECFNIETLDEQLYYIDDATADMSFSLNADNVLSTDVWVNESTSFTNEQMEEMLLKDPDNIRAERDFIGNIEQFYVRWKEVNDFFMSKPSDRHYCIDRMLSLIIFGDGIHVMIPRVTNAPAFKVTVRCCGGLQGNVPEGAIGASKSNILFINDIQNPMPSFGGSNIESVENALERGGNILNARHRLISENDYISAVKNYSGNIDKVKCVTGIMKNGSFNEDAVSIVILLRDFATGSYSFHKEQDNLRRFLYKNNELTVTDDDLHIVEPVFVKVSVEVWLRTPSMDDSFEVQNLYEKSITDYLDPVERTYHRGWNIGEMVRYSQIVMRLSRIKSRAVMGMVSVTAEYRDVTGTHVTDLKALKPSPYMICCNGKHQINISAER